MGVLHVLRELRVPVDFVVGTSIGSVVGGLYAIGYEVDTIEEKMLGSHFDEGYSDTIPREDLPYRVKLQYDQFNVPLDIGFSDGEIKTPSGILQGQSMKRLIRNLTGLVPAQKSFDDLALPYRAIATDIATRDRVVIDHGSVTTAMRASSSVPGALAPVPYQDRLLVDGGIVDNLPVETALEMGADVIIAVDIGDKPKGRESMDSTLAVIGQLTSFLTTEGQERAFAKLRPQDVYVRPDVSGMSMTNFAIMPKALEEGRKAAEVEREALSGLSVSEAEYDAYLSSRAKSLRRLHRESMYISGIKLNSDSPVHTKYIQSRFQLRPNQLLNLEQVQAAVHRVYSTDEFQQVDLIVEVDEEGRDDVRLSIERKSWGPHFFQMGLAWEESLGDQSTLDLDFAYTMRDLTRYGAEWRTQLELGNDRRILTEYYAPLVPTRWLYSRASYEYASEEWDYYLPNFPSVLVEKEYNGIELGLGINPFNSMILEGGFAWQLGMVDTDWVLDEVHYEALGGYVKFGVDTLDSLSFPTTGNRLIASAYFLTEDLETDQNVITELADSHHTTQVYEVEYKGVLTVGGHSIVAKLEWELVDTDESTVFFSRLGGFLNLSGYLRDQLIGEQKGFGALIYQWNLGRDLLDMQQYPLFLGLSYEVGNMWQNNESVSFSDVVLAGSVFIGTDTPLGPVALAYGMNEDEDESIYFYLGKEF